MILFLFTNKYKQNLRNVVGASLLKTISLSRNVYYILSVATEALVSAGRNVHYRTRKEFELKVHFDAFTPRPDIPNVIPQTREHRTEIYSKLGLLALQRFQSALLAFSLMVIWTDGLIHCIN